MGRIAPSWIRHNPKAIFQQFVDIEKDQHGYQEPQFNLVEFLLTMILFSKATMQDKLKTMFETLLLFERN